MTSNNLSPFIALPRDQRRRSDILSESTVLLTPQPFIKQEKILPPIKRIRTPRYERKLSPEAGIKVSPLTGSRGNVIANVPTKVTAPNFEIEKELVNAKLHLNLPSPLLSPHIKVNVSRKGSFSQLASKTWSALQNYDHGNQQQDGQVNTGDIVEVLSSSDGAKQLLAHRKRLKKIRPDLTRKFSYQSIGSATGLMSDRLAHRDSDVTITTDVFRTLHLPPHPGMDFVTSSGIGSTIRLRDPRSQVNSTSTTFSESPTPNDGFLPLRRRKSSNTLIPPEFDVEIVQIPDSRRRRSSVASVSFPDVLRDARLTASPRSNVRQDPRFFRIRQPTSRHTSSTSDDVIEGKSRESMPKEDNYLSTEGSRFKPGHGLSQVQRRIKVGILSHQFIREMRAKRRDRHRRRKPSAPSEQPIEKFRKIARSVRLLLRCLTDYRTIATVSETSQMPFSMFSNDLTSVRTYPGGLKFDLEDYRATSERQISPELRRIMTLAPSLRTEKELSFALKSLRVLAEAFGEFPIRMQESLVRVTWLDEFESKRVIIRQGQPAENFYFIVTGSALVSKNRIDPRTGELFVETVTILRRGMSFGELAIMRRETRNANVICNSSLALLTVGREDFIDIFMHRMDGEEPEFISFLRKRPEFAMFPLQQIPRNRPEICAFTYFRVGVVICDESTANDVIVIVKSGYCKVLKAMKRMTGDRNSMTNKFQFQSSLLTGERKSHKVGIEDHARDVRDSYNDWMMSHPLTVDLLKFLADDDEIMRREGKRRPSLIEIEHDTDHIKLAKELDISGKVAAAEVRHPKDVVYIHVQTLGEGDVFGLAPLIFEPSEGGVSMSLVSEGAECILLNKNFYLKNMDAEIRENLMRTVRPYPTVETMEDTMRQKCNWESFKHRTMEEYFTNRKAFCALKLNGFQRYR